MNWLINLLSGGIFKPMSTAIVNSASLITLAPLAYWFVANKDGIITCITYGQAAIFGGVLFVFLKLAHYTATPKNNSYIGEQR